MNTAGGWGAGVGGLAGRAGFGAGVVITRGRARASAIYHRGSIAAPRSPPLEEREAERRVRAVALHGIQRRARGGGERRERRIVLDLLRRPLPRERDLHA